MKKKPKVLNVPCGCAGRFCGPWAPEVEQRAREGAERLAREFWQEVERERLTDAQRTIEERRRHLAQVHAEEETAYQL